jgi:hypothetical protein
MEAIDLDQISVVEMDDETHDKGQRVRMQLDQIINQITSLDIGFPLTWVYVWDMVKYRYSSMSEDNGFHMANPDKTIDDVWQALWANPRFTLEYGIEQLDDDIADWLIEHKFIVEWEEGLEEEDE